MTRIRWHRTFPHLLLVATLGTTMGAAAQDAATGRATPGVQSEDGRRHTAGSGRPVHFDLVSHETQIAFRAARGFRESVADGSLLEQLPAEDRPAVRPLFHGATPTDLDRLYDGVQSAGLADHVPHLGRWFRIDARDHDHAERILRALHADPRIDFADRIPVAFPASAPAAWLPTAAAVPHDIPPTTPDFTSYQRPMWGPAPDGFEADALHRTLGSRGEGVRYYHVEVDWQIDHEDLDSITASSFVGAAPPRDPFWVVHGTVSVGVGMSQRNGYGVDGLCDQAECRLVPYLSHGGHLNGVIAAGLDARAGDVILIIFQLLGPGGPNDYVPAEIFQPFFDVVSTITANGVVVVEAAGNGGSNLDDARYMGVFDRNVRDSRAVIVGGSLGRQLQRLPASNYGSRIDVAGWGEDVVSVGGGTLFHPGGDDRQAYIQVAQNTSAASSSVAPTFVCLQGAAKAQLGRPLTPLEVRSAVTTHGTPVPLMGSRPRLQQTAEALGLVDGLQLDQHRVGLGGSFTATMTGPAGGLYTLLASTQQARLNLGLGRPLQLDLGTMVSIGAFTLDAAGQASATYQIPNIAALQLASLPLQGVRITPNGTLDLSTGCQVYIE